jgi:hypothetical protein
VQTAKNAIMVAIASSPIPLPLLPFPSNKMVIHHPKVPLFPYRKGWMVQGQWKNTKVKMNRKRVPTPN